MKILTAAEMRSVDRTCIEDLGIFGHTLMENASLQAYDALTRRFPDLNSLKVTVVCGKGNNGGDGLATARHIATRGGTVRAILLATARDLKGDALTNLEMMMAAGVKITEVTDKTAWHRAWSEEETDMVVDAIFGTGLTTAASGLYALVIDDLNSSGKKIISIDVPSGLSSDTGEIIGPAIQANLTVSLQCLKRCHVFPPAAKYCGDVEVVPIGIPQNLLENPSHRMEFLDGTIGTLLATRRRDSHKGSYGHALVIAGSTGKTGAAVMTGIAALRAGAGLVTVATPRSCLPIVAAGAPEIMTEPLDETEIGSLSMAALDRVRELSAGKDVLIIGPGLTTHPVTVCAIKQIVRTRKVPVVLDADGINSFSGSIDLLKSPEDFPPLVITPHPGELARLDGRTVGEILRDRPTIASKIACELRIYVVLKGYRTVIATPDGWVYVNPTGNPGMATGGSGDVLTGIIGGLLSQGMPLPEAVNLGVYVHGLAGDLAANDLGEISLIATDIIKFLPTAFIKLRSQSGTHRQ